MAITRAQQAKQMLQNGGRIGFFRGAQADASAGRGSMSPGTSGRGGTRGGTGRGRDTDVQQRGMTKADYDATKGDRAQNFGGRQNTLEKAFSNVKDYVIGGGLIGAGVRGLSNIFGGPKSFSDTYGYATDYQGTTGPSSVDDDDTGQGEDGIRYFERLGFPTESAYLASLSKPTSGLPAAVQPMQSMNLNRIAYRLMADGGFLGEEDEPRQAYGLGSIVRKITRPVKKVVKKATSAVKKVAKSPLGRLALSVAAPYALGPAMNSARFLAGLSAAQKAALVSGATSGITQLASGEDLDLKQIALSSALAGGTAKMFPGNIPGKPMPQGVSGSNKALFTSDAAMRGTSRLVDADDVVLASQRASSIIPKAKPIIDSGTKSNLFSRIAEGVGNIGDSKFTDLLLRNDKGKISPMKSILLASGLAGLMAKKDQEPDEFSEMDRGEGIDIAAIRRRPFDYMAPRFAGSQFDFYAADGGRIGYSDGTNKTNKTNEIKTNEIKTNETVTQEAGAVLSEKEIKKLAKSALYKGFKKMYSVDPQMAKDNPAYEGKFDIFKKIYDKKFQKGGKAEPVAKKVMPLLDMGGMEKDYREDGGFVPIGRMEKADDVPARLSKNEFVFTADAVRNAGDGDVDKGAEVMYNMMKNLESGGNVSEESQGLKGARKMFQTSQRLEEVL